MYVNKMLLLTYLEGRGKQGFGIFRTAKLRARKVSLHELKGIFKTRYAQTIENPFL